MDHGSVIQGLKPVFIVEPYAALKRRSSTLLETFDNNAAFEHMGHM
ncbi:MAG: hypothetical protein WA416_06195 [Candidatus Sulfotelmatobacter sp.]